MGSDYVSLVECGRFLICVCVDFRCDLIEFLSDYDSLNY